MRADFPSPHREKLGAQKKLIPLYISPTLERGKSIGNLALSPSRENKDMHEFR
jgi:hypothetical protein